MVANASRSLRTRRIVTDQRIELAVDRLTLIDQVLLSYVVFVDHFDGVLRFVLVILLRG